MSENEKDENSLTESQENVEQNDNSFDNNIDSKMAVSYTHLTLPTNREV